MRICLLISCIIFSQLKAEQTNWSTCGRALLLNGKSFFVKGVNYSPVPIGQSSGQDFLTKSHIWTRDFALLRAMHANAIKVYDYNTHGDHQAALDAAYNGGFEPIYIVFTLWLPPYVMMSHIDINSDTFIHYVNQYRKMAEQIGHHPATMGFSIGGEINMHPHVMEEPFWLKFNRLCQAVREGLAVHQSKKILTTTFIDDGSASFEAGDKFNADVDIWGASVYQKDYARDMLALYRKKSQRPIVFAEYGLSYSPLDRDATDQEVDEICRLIEGYSRSLRDNFIKADELDEQLVVGGFLFEFSDEWWKSGAFEAHDRSGFSNPNFPFGHMAEEYFGLFQISQQTAGNTNILTPRPIVSKLTHLWTDSIGGEYVDACGGLDLSPTQASTAAPTSTPEPPTALIECYAGIGNLEIGIDMYYDTQCFQGGLGCDSAQLGCRYCISFGTGPYVPCPKSPATESPTRSPTKSPTEAPTAPPMTETPTPRPTEPPTEAPTAPPMTETPTPRPTEPPTEAPTAPPMTEPPTPRPTEPPTEAPTAPPMTEPPTSRPTEPPTEVPTEAPTSIPTDSPVTQQPTPHPTGPPTKKRKPTTIKCHATQGNQANGIGMVFDQTCISMRGGLGCDMALLGCRYCMLQDSGRDGPYFPCDNFSTPSPTVESEVEHTPVPSRVKSTPETTAPDTDESEQSVEPSSEPTANETPVPSNESEQGTPEPPTEIKENRTRPVSNESSSEAKTTTTSIPTPNSFETPSPTAVAEEPNETSSPEPSTTAYTAPPPCPLNQSFVDAKIGVYHDSRCGTIGGLGCDPLHPGCRYCDLSKLNENLLPCDSLNIAADCASSGTDMANGISSYFDRSCFVKLSWDCQLTHAGCRYCRYRSTRYSLKFHTCPDQELEKLSEYLSGETIKSESAFPIAVVASTCGAIGVIGILIAAVVARKRRRNHQDIDQDQPFDLPPLVLTGPSDEVTI